MNEIEIFLASKNVRPTAMRILVFRWLAKRKTAVTLTDMEVFFEKSDRTTLYRTIKTFEENGIVHRINDGGGIPKYAICAEGCRYGEHHDLHLHFHCTRCDETSCLTDHQIPQVNLPKGYLVEDMNLVVNGLCDSCNVD
ncbi:transcriptional repressor [Flavobacteriaceae bacterium TP-CH-4]|uniref:Transcriptional repressor n=1 Tax=Pelagihabitans pacificus TaxID=2696054 RepID=A0A967B3M8_9FLAO|nr:transcriptional repressor [Pelagihabitans pacificus]NHF61436.1 transcriptional repressor [Pelagihabitans pacificus]